MKELLDANIARAAEISANLDGIAANLAVLIAMLKATTLEGGGSALRMRQASPDMSDGCARAAVHEGTTAAVNEQLAAGAIAHGGKAAAMNEQLAAGATAHEEKAAAANEQSIAEANGKWAATVSSSTALSAVETAHKGVATVQLPAFEGEDLIGWVVQAGKQFEFYGILPERKVAAVIVAMEGSTCPFIPYWITWLQGYYEYGGIKIVSELVWTSTLRTRLFEGGWNVKNDLPAGIELEPTFVGWSLFSFVI